MNSYYILRIMKKIIKFISIIILISIFALCIWTPIWFYNLDAPGISRGKERAETIISALEKYNNEMGSFPSHLPALEPIYISRIPNAGWRYDYCYELREDNTYTLAFIPRGEAIGDGWVVYWSKYDRWERTDSDFCCGCHFYDYYD
jgi:hypothetical protein